MTPPRENESASANNENIASLVANALSSIQTSIGKLSGETSTQLHALESKFDVLQSRLNPVFDLLGDGDDNKDIRVRFARLKDRHDALQKEVDGYKKWFSGLVVSVIFSLVGTLWSMVQGQINESRDTNREHRQEQRDRKQDNSGSGGRGTDSSPVSTNSNVQDILAWRINAFDRPDHSVHSNRV